MSEPITGFTPGPWARNHTKVESRDEHGWANEGWIVCECLGPDAEANAAVIAETRNATPGLIAQITNQEAEISRLKQALEEIKTVPWGDSCDHVGKIRRIARAALTSSPLEGEKT